MNENVQNASSAPVENAPVAEQPKKKGGKLKFWGWFAIIVILLCAGGNFAIKKCMTIVKPYEAAVKVQLGAVVDKSYGQGPVWNLPIPEYGFYTHVINVTPKRYEYNPMHKTKDLQDVSFSYSFLCEPVDTVVHKFYQKYPEGYDTYKAKVIDDRVNHISRALAARIEHNQGHRLQDYSRGGYRPRKGNLAGSRKGNQEEL